MGDFNINYEDRSTAEYRELNFTTQALGLKQFISLPTRYSFRDGTIKHSTLDLVFSNSDFDSRAKTLNLNISDHRAVVITRKKIFVKHEKINFEGRSYRNYNSVDFQRQLTEAHWEQFCATEDPDLQWELMWEKILGIINTMCPLKTFKVNSIREPWKTNEALEAIRDKAIALRRAKRTGKAEDWERARRVRKETGRDLRNLRADFLKNQQEENDPKKFWKVSSIIPNQKSESHKIRLKNSETGQFIDPQGTADYINNENRSQLGKGA